MSKSFIIRPPKWIRNYYTAIFCFSAVGIIAFIILYSKELLHTAAFTSLTAVFGLLFLAGVIGTILYYGEKFYFKDGVYCSKKPFKKMQYAALRDIAVVEIKSCKKRLSPVEIIFKSSSNEVLIDLYTDGWIFRKNIFTYSLKQNRIHTVNAIAS